MNEWGAVRRPFLFVVDYKQERVLLEELGTVDPSLCRYDFNGVTNVDASVSVPVTETVRWQTFPETEAEYAAAFEVVHRHLLAGNSFLTNLTRRVPVETNLSLEELFHRSRAPYRLWLRDRFTCFSPEIFVRIRQGHIYAYPMKGTIDAALPDARRRLFEDGKEAAEHATIVDLLRNDLSMHATGVTVCRYRYFDLLQTNRGALWQTSSEIGGRLPDDYRSQLGRCSSTCFRQVPSRERPSRRPAPSLPRRKDTNGGFYTGVAGVFDGDNLDSCVLIRFVEQEGGRLWFKAGGGITYRSDVHSEYEEVIQKVYVPIY